MYARRVSELELARKGVDNLVGNHLRLERGERLVLFHVDADALLPVLREALRDAGGELVDVPLERHRESPEREFVELVKMRATGADVSMYVSTSSGPMFPRAQLLIQSLEGMPLRHLHVPGASLRMLGGSLRADPTLIARINERLAEHLESGRLLTVKSPKGTDLEVELRHSYPIVQYRGVPERGGWDSVPTGAVSFHSPAVSGTFVADRIVSGTHVERPNAELFRRPLRLTLSGGRLRGYESDDAALVEELKAHLAHDADADYVGFVSMSTNYLTRNELKVFANDALLPGLRLMLGYSDPKKTKAPRCASVWSTFHGRKHTVSVDGRVIVRDGRIDAQWTQGILPF